MQDNVELTMAMTERPKSLWCMMGDRKYHPATLVVYTKNATDFCLNQHAMDKSFGSCHARIGHFHNFHNDTKMDMTGISPR